MRSAKGVACVLPSSCGCEVHAYVIKYSPNILTLCTSWPINSLLDHIFVRETYDGQAERDREAGAVEERILPQYKRQRGVLAGVYCTQGAVLMRHCFHWQHSAGFPLYGALSLGASHVPPVP